MDINELGPTGFFRHWMSGPQRLMLVSGLKGEEKQFFSTMLDELKARIESMPKSYETDGQGDDAVVYLHYFGGSIDAWVTEKDMGDPDDDPDLRGMQSQAYGRVNLDGTGIRDAETGYVSIQELIENGMELDLFWTPIPLKDCK